jgi:bla regulator protein BlaR1
MDILQMSASAGILIILIVLIRLFTINRLPKTMFIMLWGIALLRLIIPFSIPLNFGINNILKKYLTRIFLKPTELPNGDQIKRVFFFQGTEHFGINTARLFDAYIFVWLAGAAVTAVIFAFFLYRGHREVRTALPARDKFFVDKWLSKQKLKRKIRILISDKISTPLTYGVIKPRIILPKRMDFNNEAQLNFILTHELVHIRRFDALWKFVLVFTLCFHWFNPLVWVMYVMSNRDMEIACDEKVIRIYGKNKKTDYAMSLIEMAQRKSGFTPLYSNFSRNATEERIISIMKFRKTSVISIILSLLLITGAASVFIKSTANFIFKLNGEFSTAEGGRYSYQLGENGRITVKNAGGKVVSTAVLGSDGKADLTDADGNIIKKLDVAVPEILKYGKVARPPLYRAEIGQNGKVTVKDADGQIIATGNTGTTDNAGTTDPAGSDAYIALKDADGTIVGSVVVNNNRVTRLLIQDKKQAS